MSSLTLEERARKNLEWEELLERIESHCPSRAAARAVRALGPERDREAARRAFEETKETLELYREGATLPARDVPDLNEVLMRLGRGARASAIELRDLGILLRYAGELRAFCRDHADARPALRRALGSEMTTLEREIARAIDDDGTIMDTASVELARARSRARKARADLVSELGLSLKRHATLLRDAFHSEWEGRYVLPVRSDSYQRGMGIVLGSSGSGATLYVEPHEVTELGNRFKLAQTDVASEEEKVLGALAAVAHTEIAALFRAEAAATAAGRLIAIARWAQATDSVPVPITEEGGVTLRGMRHPLMAGEALPVVPNDLLLERGSALVISGPNAGGKTVLLKCLGLAVWMARAGLPVPAALGSSVGWFDPVLTDFGDEQSIAHSLSTFSAHVRSLGAMLTHARGEALVLIDEVGSGTDPEEGSALAAAVLEQLVVQGAAVAVTTHYELLKELAAARPNLMNASMVFDFELMRPTFRLLTGVPGRSSALLVAARFGIPEHILARAEALLPSQALEREQAVSQLNQERAALVALREELERAAKRQAELLVEAEAERKRAREQERRRLAEEAQALTLAVKQARASLDAVKKRLASATPDKAELRELARSVDEAARHVAVGSELQVTLEPENVQGTPATEAELAVGTKVYLRKLGRYGTVAEAPKRGRVSVHAGAVRLNVPLAELLVAEQGPGEAKTESASRGPARGPARNSAPQPSARQGNLLPTRQRVPRTSETTLDLRGVRVEEGLEQVDDFIGTLLTHGQSQGFVLHGHGTGAMKTAVRAHLAESGWVVSSEPASREDGGDAFTVFWLRD